MFISTTATKKIFQLRKRIRAVTGGTAASKTISILMWCIDYAQSTENQLITVVSESFPHLEGGAIRDFKKIMKTHNYWQDSRWNETKHFYTFEKNTVLEFVSVDTYGKAHGPRRDVLFINEANYLSYLIADQLITRTSKIVWLDWNPTNEFWFYSEMLGKRQDLDFITLTYLDNEALDSVTINEIESHRANQGWWKVYGMGQLGEIEGKVYKGWQIIDEIPHEARLERRGLDFGYTNDPTGLLDIYYYNGGYIWDEQLYQKGMSNKQIADVINNLDKKQTMVVADSAEPKSIDEMKLYGINIFPAQKGQGSVLQGIQYVQGQQISMTKRSINLIKEYRNHMFKVDKDGKTTNIPDEGFNHLLDAGRYAMESLRPNDGQREEARRVANQAINEDYWG